MPAATMARPASSAERPYISFHREAESLDSAIRSAAADVQKKPAALSSRVQIEHDSPLLSSARLQRAPRYEGRNATNLSQSPSQAGSRSAGANRRSQLPLYDRRMAGA